MERKPKKGDWVTIIQENYSGTYQLGDLADHHGPDWHYMGEGAYKNVQFHFPTQFRFATDEEIRAVVGTVKPKFKSGDLVRLTKPYGNLKEEQIVQLSEIQGSIHKSGDSNTCWYIKHFPSGEPGPAPYERDMVLATSEEIEKARGYTTAGKPIPERVEVFPGIFVGDVVVSLADINNSRNVGDMFSVLSNSSKGVLYYRLSLSSGNSTQWRLATPKEAEAYQNRAKNISEIKEEEKKWVKGGYVRILRDGDYKGVSYKKGEIWHLTKDVDFRETTSNLIYVKRGSFETNLLVEPSKPSISECEWVGMTHPGESVFDIPKIEKRIEESKKPKKISAVRAKVNVGQPGNLIVTKDRVYLIKDNGNIIDDVGTDYGPIVMNDNITVWSWLFEDATDTQSYTKEEQVVPPLIVDDSSDNSPEFIKCIDNNILDCTPGKVYPWVKGKGFIDDRGDQRPSGDYTPFYKWLLASHFAPASKLEFIRQQEKTWITGRVISLTEVIQNPRATTRTNEIIGLQNPVLLKDNSEEETPLTVATMINNV